MFNFSDEKYILLFSTKVRNFKKKNSNLYNFSCMSCGDSHSDKRKARGYLFREKNTWFYKCHNCNLSTNFQSILRKHAPELYQSYSVESFYNEPYTTKKIEFDIKDSNVKKLSGFAKAIKYLSKDHIAIKYLTDRKIPKSNYDDLYFTDNLNHVKSLFKGYDDVHFPIEGRILIPIYDESNQIRGLAARAINYSKLRYIILKDADYDNGLVYNIQNIEWSKQKYVLEGAFDSMFIENSVAVSGLDMIKTFKMFDDKTIYICDNQPRNKSVITMMEKIIKANKKIFIWPENIKEKDVNQAVLSNINIQENINNHSYSGFEAELNLAKWRKV